MLLRHVTAIRQDAPRAFAYLSMACNHCEEPACVANCPVGGLQQAGRRYGDSRSLRVHRLQDLHLGLPYGAPSYDEASSTTFKCDGCYDRRQRGELPACVAACPVQIWPSMTWSLCRGARGRHRVRRGSGTKPNFVITVDAALAEEPDDIVAENHTA